MRFNYLQWNAAYVDSLLLRFNYLEWNAANEDSLLLRFNYLEWNAAYEDSLLLRFNYLEWNADYEDSLLLRLVEIILESDSLHLGDRLRFTHVNRATMYDMGPSLKSIGYSQLKS